jgi:peroxiredoxin
MNQTVEQVIEDAFRDARDQDSPLGHRLGLVAERIRAILPDACDVVDGFVRRLEDAKAGQQAPQIGTQMPNFILPDDEGRLVSLSQLLEQAPVVVAFHRGHWCPYCRLNAVGLATIESDIKPVQIVAISAEVQSYTRQIKAESGATFPFLTDVGNGYALSLNLAIWVDDITSSIFGDSEEDIKEYQNQNGWLLPIPSVFVVRQDGIIHARHIDPDYRRRMELDDIVAAAKAALN